MTDGARRQLLLALPVLLIVALSLAARADDLSIWPDETWSVFHSERSVAQILREPELVWPPGYYLLLHAWIKVTGTTHDFVLHALGAFLGLLTSACLIRAGRLLQIRCAGELAAFAFGTSGYAVYFLLELRGYGLMLLAEAGFLWAFLSWLRRPGRYADLAVVFALTAMLYTHFLLGTVIALTTVYVATKAPRRFGRWLLLVGLAALSFLPLLPQFLLAYRLRSAIAASGPLPSYFLQGLDSFLRAYSAGWDPVFLAIAVAAAIGLGRLLPSLGWRRAAWLAVWAAGLPLAAYLARESAAYFTPRYLAFTMPAAFVLIGAGLGGLPRPWIGAGLVAVLALAPFQPFDFRPSYADFPPIRDLFRMLARELRRSDRMVLDPSLEALIESMEWEYYRPLYLPEGDPLLPPDGSASPRRVWYIARQGALDPEVRDDVARGRVERYAWGPWYLRAVLFESPPEESARDLAGGLRTLGADVERAPTVHAGDTLKVALWWSHDHPIPPDLTIWLSLHGPDGGTVVAVGEPPRTVISPHDLEGWTPETIYLDIRRIRIPYRLPDGDYTLRLTVRDPRGTLLPVEGSDGSLLLDRFHVYSAAFW